MGHAQAKKAPAPSQARGVLKRRLRVMPVLKLGVGRDLIVQSPSPKLCQATHGGGSCKINCTTGDPVKA